MWDILSKKDIEIRLPYNFNDSTMYRFIDEAIDEQCNAKCSTLTFDFSNLNFIEPVGVVVLTNLIEYLKTLKVKVKFKNHSHNTAPTRYLDDSGFFKLYLKNNLFSNPTVRTTTMPLQFVANNDAISYLNFKLIPWVAREVNLSEDSLSAIKTSIEEIFLNIKHHSGVGNGCVFAQHFPKKNEIQLAISDFGLGIPKKVRSVIPNISDSEALKIASKEGFTTQSNVRNRGAGLTNITRYITQRNGGTVLICSGKSRLSAVQSNQTEPKMTFRSNDNFYPGTLVRAILKTDTFEDVIKDSEREVFEW